MRIAAVVVLLLLNSGMLSMANTELPDWCRKLPRAANKALERILPDEPWFEVYRVRPGVFALYEPRQYEEVISYLITGTRRALLLDTGMGIAPIRPVVERLTKLPVTVINTHTHPDHIGGNAEFENIRALDVPFSRQNAAGYSGPEMKDWVSAPNLCGPLPPAFDPASYKIREYRISSFLQDGETIDLGERTLRVLLTPGHTPDSLCLVDETNGLLFTGDTFYAGTIYLYVPGTSIPQYIQSLEKLIALGSNIKLLLPSHNEITASPDFLPKVLDGIRQVQSGKIQPVTKPDGLREYLFNGFSFLMAKE